MTRLTFVVGGETVYRYYPDEPFTVDGIRYVMPPCLDGSVYPRPMLWVIADQDEHDDDAARMFHSDPPTEAELDLYVDQRILPPT